MKLRELLTIIDPDEVVVVHFGFGRGFRSVVKEVPTKEEYAKHLDSQVTFLAHFNGKGQSGYDIYLKNKEE